MKLILNPNKNIIEEKVTIEYNTMTPKVKRVVAVVQDEQDFTQVIGKDEAKDLEVFLKVGDLYYVDAVDKRVYAYTKTGVYKVALTLSEFESQYQTFGFVRINKSNVVNVNHIKAIQPAPNMRVHVILENGERLVINRSYKQGLEQFLKTGGRD